MREGGGGGVGIRDAQIGRPTNVLVGELVGETDSLRLVLDRLAIDDGALELLDDGPMDGVALLFGC